MYNFKDNWKRSNIKFKRHTKIKRGALDIAPLIDVVFLLLIFFMLTSSFVSQPGIKVHLPKAITGEMLSKNVTVITITQGNKIFLDNKRVDFKNLKDELKEITKDKENALLIKADAGAFLGHVVKVWDLCRELGISQVNIATTTEKQ